MEKLCELFTIMLISVCVAVFIQIAIVTLKELLHKGDEDEL